MMTCPLSGDSLRSPPPLGHPPDCNSLILLSLQCKHTGTDLP
jgi:hypothetical protein